MMDFKKYIILFFCFLAACDNNFDYVIHTDGTPPEKETIYVTVEPDVDVWVDSFIQVGAYEDIDILWVIDGSCSMVAHEPALMDGIDHMINNLPPDVNWRLKMITAGDGSRIAQSTTFPLTRGDTVSDAVNMYNQLPYDGSEAGFSAVQNYMMFDTYAKTWMRPTAALLVVFVTDEKEQSTLTSTEFINWYGLQRPSVYLAFIGHVYPSDSICSYIPNSTMVGVKYMDAVNFFAGNIIDICEEDWSSGVDEATQNIKPYEEYELQHIPYEDTIVVFEDGLPMEKSLWSYDSATNIVYFNVIPLEGALVEMAYSIKYYRITP